MSWAGTASRRRPWPYDAYIGNVKVMLEPGEDGNLVAQKTKTLDQIAPSNYEYSSANPYLERTESYEQLFGGLGQRIQPETKPRRYAYAERADLSIDGYWMKGPRFETHVETITGAGEIRQFIKALAGGVESVFAICQNGVWIRTADGTWQASLTATTTPALPGGTSPQQAARFKGRGGVTGDYLFVASSAGNIWQFTGTAWSVAGGSAGPLNPITASDGQARFIERVGDELWVAGDYWVVKVEEDPMDRTKYAGAIYIGDQTSKITYLKSINNVLYIFKTDGLYTISTAGVDQEIFPTLRGKISSDNGKNAAVWMNRMWFSFQNDTYNIDMNGLITPDGLEQHLENVTPVIGHYVAGAGHNTWFMYEVLYDLFTNTSHLIKHGTWVENPDDESSLRYLDAHHGSLCQWSKRATSAQVISNVHASGNDRLYIGFADETLEWCVLPQASPNPVNDNFCEFTNLDSYVYLPIHHANFQADNKFWRGVSIFGPHLTANEWVEVQYRYDLTNPSALWLTLKEDDPKFVIPGQRKDFPTLDPIFSHTILFRVKMSRSPTLSPDNFSPVINGINVHQSIRPEVSLEYVASVKAASYIAKHNGSMERRRGATIRDDLFAEMSKIGATLVRFEDGNTQEVIVVDYKESKIPKQKRRDIGWLIQITFMQVRTVTNVAADSGITYATLEKFTLGELEDLL